MSSSATLPDFQACREVLVIKPSSLGDIVHTLPAVHWLKQHFPQLRFTWMVHPAFAPLLEENPDLSGILTFPRETFRGPAGWLRFGHWLRRFPANARPDVALDFQGLLRSGLTALASRARLRVGFSDSREGSRFFHTHRVRVDPHAHAIDRTLSLVRELGGVGPFCFPLPEGNRPAALRGDGVPPGAILLHPFSRGRDKSLTVQQTLRLCHELAPLPVILAGRSGTTLPASLPENTLNLLNQTTLPELVWLLRHVRGVISVDSGPMHIAAALSPRVLSLHTWSDPQQVGPWHPGTMVWKAGQLTDVSQLDPAVCRKSTNIPDSAMPAIAAWAHRLGVR